MCVCVKCVVEQLPARLTRQLLGDLAELDLGFRAQGSNECQATGFKVWGFRVLSSSQFLALRFRV